MNKGTLKAVKLLQQQIIENFGECDEFGGLDCASCRATVLSTELDWLKNLIEWNDSNLDQ